MKNYNDWLIIFVSKFAATEDSIFKETEVNLDAVSLVFFHTLLSRILSSNSCPDIVRLRIKNVRE